MEMKYYYAKAAEAKRKLLEGDGNKPVSVDPSMLGKKINRIFPLLDPNENEDTRILKHQDWFS
eukprot:CAMPEP_0176358550 /NCGR_PEP_ID=MMETSP0126-20121128/15648_1 /TAXON_ID=141414 ORGANISM="Strombidinopsis acuminatum, Strain SPMC142" /NCGR_SAMPLE_ID=MMETSP0126 /ASSEMBLY_ACC=CAM_ASM_000229 /LENGTH=62 /DNA_ID=CAMNT_0017712795 /DNA_START=2143 /DNA_END=2331 /DNA_ORIENTATION=-